MTFATELSSAAQQGLAQARVDALAKGLAGQALGQAVLEGRWLTVNEIMYLPIVQALTEQDRNKARQTAQPYAQAGWMMNPGAGVDLDAMLRASTYRIGGEGTAPLVGADSSEHFVTMMRVVNGIINAASLFVPHGQPTAPKSNAYNGIAVKFDDDHLCEDAKAASATTARRAIARSTMLQKGEGKMLSAEVDALNKVSYFQYVEAYLKQRYAWNPSYEQVEGICYLSKESVRIAWEITGAASNAGGAIDTFTKPAKVTGHVLYAVKPDQADPNAASEPGKCKRLLYHFEGIVPNAAIAPPGSWDKIGVDEVLAVAKLKSGMEAAIRAAAVPVYYRTGAA